MQISWDSNWLSVQNGVAAKKVLSDFVARTSRQCTTSSSRLTSPSTRTSPSGRSLRRPSTTLKASPESVSSTRSRLLLKATFTTTTMTRKLQRMEDLFKSNYELKIMLARCITILLKIVAGNCISAQKENVSFSAEMHQWSIADSVWSASCLYEPLLSKQPEIPSDHVFFSLWTIYFFWHKNWVCFIYQSRVI